MKESGTVKFLLNKKAIELDYHGTTKYTPTTTLLNYLRDDAQLTGTKEGCAEGDCGACTVVLVSLGAQDQVCYQATDSCLIFLPMLHGKAVITVEYIGSIQEPHPVQNAMVDCDGSQCGYCTPGFIMSLYALHQNHDSPNIAAIEDALTGNLCRCTGYRSILESAKQSSTCYPAVSPKLQASLKQSLQNMANYSLAIIGNKQKYFKPIILTEALRLRSMYPEATIINGATDIALKVTKSHQVLPEILDLSALKELSQIEMSDTEVSFGAGMSLEQVKKKSEQLLPAFYETLKVFGSLQIRNLATLGGNLGSASPIGDTLPILMAYQAQVELIGTKGLRRMFVRDFICGYRATQLKSDELILRVIIPLPTAKTQIKWYKISKRKDLDISSVSAGFRIELDKESQITALNLYYGGMAEMTKNAEKAEQFLTGKYWNRENVDSAMALIDQDFTPISDARAEANGRQIMARNLLLKFWSETHE